MRRLRFARAILFCSAPRGETSSEAWRNLFIVQMMALEDVYSPSAISGLSAGPEMTDPSALNREP